MPHCDERVLHRPGKCEYCDAYPDWQDLRVRWAINFTGENANGKTPCPSTLRRPLETIERWPGNRPSPLETKRHITASGGLVSLDKEIPPVDRSCRTLTDGSPVTEDHREIDPATGQQKAYVVLCPEERAKGFVRPVRRSYKHLACGSVTTMGLALAETYARDPGFYHGTMCASCGSHFSLDQFVWDGTDEIVGS